MRKMLTISAAFVLFSAAAQAGVVESFDTGAYGPGWAFNNGTVTAAAAHDGGFGLNMANTGGVGGWNYNTSLAVSEGDVLSAWIRFHGSGRAYFGFGADATGTQSFVAGTNTNQSIFQDNSGYGFANIGSNSFGFADNHWYRLEIDWMAGGQALGKVYDSDGTTLLNSLAQVGLPRSSGGIALRGFPSIDVDTISVNGAVPEPMPLGLLALGLAGAALSRRRKV